MHMKNSSVWKFLQNNTWEHVHLCWEGSVDDNVLAWKESKLFDSVYWDRGSVSI